MKILAIDTATEACSAALYVDGKVRSHYQLAPREHSLLILKMVEQLLVDANAKVKQLDAITFGRGPGSFMGLRIAAGVVQGIAYAHDIPVIPLSTLQVIAQRARRSARSWDPRSFFASSMYAGERRYSWIFPSRFVAGAVFTV